MKTPERPRRSRLVGSVERLESRELLTLAATAPLPDVNLAAGSAATPVSLDSYFKDPQATPDFAIFNTTQGTIPVLLTPQTTPKTVANFMSYANKGAYTNSIVHRSVPGFIWQAGGFQLSGQTSAATPATAPVANEFGASNVRGTIAMAKLGSDPNSATSQFFFNESNANAANLDNQNGGFTVFGNVVGTAGLAVMDAIASVPVPTPGPLASPFDSAPLQGYKAGQPVMPSNLVLIQSVTPASELFLATSDAPGVATASVQGSSLMVNSASPGTAHITVTGYGSDGKTATESFTVTVNGPTPTGTTAPGSPSTVTASSTPPGSTPSSSTTPPATVSPSALIPTASGPLPASAIAGRTIIRQLVTLTTQSMAVAPGEHVALSLSTTTTGAANDFTLANATTRFTLKAGKRARLPLAGRLSAAVPVGTYHLLASVTDPNGAETTIDTGKTLIVQAPQARVARQTLK